MNVLLDWRTSCVEGRHKFVVPNYLHLSSADYAALIAAGLQMTAFMEVGRTARLPGLPMTLVLQARHLEVSDE